MLQQSLVVFAKDKDRVAAYYRQSLDLSVVQSEPSHDLMRADGVEVIVHSIPESHAAAIVIDSPPVPREDTPFKPVFVVASLAAVRRAAEATGGHLRPDSAAWQFEGRVILDGWDPEGNIVQFQQAL